MPWEMPNSPGGMLQGDGGHVADQELLVGAGWSKDLHAPIVEAITHLLVQPLHTEPEQATLPVQRHHGLVERFGPKPQIPWTGGRQIVFASEGLGGQRSLRYLIDTPVEGVLEGLVVHFECLRTPDEVQRDGIL